MAKQKKYKSREYKPVPVTKPRDKIKGGNKRKDWEITRDRALISELFFKNNLSHAKIADVLNNRNDVDYTLTGRTIGNEVEAIIKIWREGQADSDVWVDQEMIRLNGIEQSAWEAWQKSLEPRERTRKVERTSDSGYSTEIEELIENQVGNPAYLKIILDCIDKRSKLRGLYVNKLEVKQQTEHHVKMYSVVSPGDWDKLPTPKYDQAQIIDGEVIE